jgi:hypothetical protein
VVGSATEYTALRGHITTTKQEDLTMHMLPRDMQLANEHSFSRKHIDGYILDALQTGDMQRAISHGVSLLEEWQNQSYYTSKDKRLDQLGDLDLHELVTKIMQGIAYVQKPELFTSVSAQLAGRLQFSDKPEAIATMAEMLAVLCETDMFDIIKESRQASLMIESRIPLSQELLQFIDNTTFQLPMVCSPEYVDHNRKSGYLSYNDSLILGSGNHHEGDLCLDVINLQNNIPLKLNIEFLKEQEMLPNFKIVTPEQREQWEAFKHASHRIWLLIYNQGNKFYLTNKVDKRGRLYSVGYHINTQGNQFQKAMVELDDEEVVEGI